MTGSNVVTEIRDSKYEREIADGLNTAYRDAFRISEPFVIGSTRMIIFSDLHKGARNDADDFRRCEQAYNAALAFYYASGSWLVELGDVEELWEERPKTVIRHYERTLRLSAKFHIDPDQRGCRYTRIWGNHDDHWNRPARVDELLGPIYCPDRGSKLPVYGSVIVAGQNAAGDPIGELFLAHGHQGTFESDKANGVSRLVVRYLWRPFQRLTNISLNTPAKDWVLRERHNIAMHRWVTSLNRTDLVFVAGHTHRPVFLSKTRSDLLTEEIRAIEDALRTNPADSELVRRLADLSAELEWARAQGRGETGIDGIVNLPRACYFNSGCAAYLDGDVTGLEIVDDVIRLVRCRTIRGPRGRPSTRASRTLFSFPSSALFNCALINRFGAGALVIHWALVSVLASVRSRRHFAYSIVPPPNTLWARG